jgi:hypothetical protein
MMETRAAIKEAQSFDDQLRTHGRAGAAGRHNQDQGRAFGQQSHCAGSSSFAKLRRQVVTACFPCGLQAARANAFIEYAKAHMGKPRMSW